MRAFHMEGALLRARLCGRSFGIGIAGMTFGDKRWEGLWTVFIIFLCVGGSDIVGYNFQKLQFGLILH